MRHSSFVTLALACFIAGNAHAADPALVELHVLQTVTLTDEQFLAGDESGRPVSVAAELRLPRLDRGPLPAIVIIHGSGGIRGSVQRWSQELNDVGIATFVLDGFTSRGIVDISANQSQLGRLAMINDAYRALDLLAKDPRIDPSRIGLLGFSRGASVALYSSMTRFQKLYGTPRAQFAVYLPFYASCNMTFVNDTELAQRPVRLFHGAADNIAPVDACRAHVERLKRSGNDVTLTEYAGAYHAFDDPALPLTQLPKLQSQGKCILEESQIGHLFNRATGQAFSWTDSCVQIGGTVGSDARALAESIKDVTAILERELSPCAVTFSSA